MKRAALIVVLLLCATYGGDYLSLALRFPGHRDPFGTVQVKRYYAVRLKGNKVEYYALDPATEQCVYSLFPHFGDDPCWYVTRHTRKQIDM